VRAKKGPTVADEPQFESVITQVMRDTIGVDTPATVYEVTTTGVRMFARAVGYDDPVYYDRAEARRRGFRDLPAPPGFLGAAVFHPETSNPIFSTPRDSQPRVRSPYKLILNGGTHVEYTGEDIVAGDELTARSKLERLTERYSAALGGPMLIQVVATTYRNQANRIVAIARGTSISYGPRADDTGSGPGNLNNED
jgi:hypothetical protein